MRGGSLWLQQLVLPRLEGESPAGTDLGVETGQIRDVLPADDQSTPVLILRIHVELCLCAVALVHPKGATRDAGDSRPPADHEDMALERARNGDRGVGDVLRQLVVQPTIVVHGDLHPLTLDDSLVVPAFGSASTRVIDEMLRRDVFVDVDSNGHGVAFL